MTATERQMVEVERRRFTSAEYHRLARAGILREDERVELIGGDIVRMSAKGSLHNAGVIALDDGLRERLTRRDAIISVQNSIQLGEHHEPEPDIAVLRPRPDRYRSALPRPENVLLLIEVSDTSLAYDRNVKLPLYAEAAIAEVWIVDLAGEMIERYTDPAGTIYRSVYRAGRGGELRTLALPEIVLAVDEILG